MPPYHFLYPADIRGRVDETFAEQYDATLSGGFTATLVSDDVIAGRAALDRLPDDVTVVYRGWMLAADRYQTLIDAVSATGASPLTTEYQYLAAHHLPNWYPRLSEYTPETHTFAADADLEAAARGLGWDRFFVKDYVKSLKTGPGSVTDASGLAKVVAMLGESRGMIEGGVCLRRVEEYVPGSEVRYFVRAGQAYAATGGPVPEIVAVVAGRIASPFFSVDIATRTDGVPRVVEVGDGQVSDLVGWTAEQFLTIWR